MTQSQTVGAGDFFKKSVNSRAVDLAKNFAPLRVILKNLRSAPSMLRSFFPLLIFKFLLCSAPRSGVADKYVLEYSKVVEKFKNTNLFPNRRGNASLESFLEKIGIFFIIPSKIAFVNLGVAIAVDGRICPNAMEALI